MGLSKNKPTLKIHPAPFKPSRLGIPASPFSPLYPITPPPAYSQKPVVVTLSSHSCSSPPPASPLQWLWQCHQCSRTYALGVTRRCLEDGHFFCAGTTTVKSWRRAVSPRKTKRHRACASEFDYQGWKNWGRWRRSGVRRDSIYFSSPNESPQTALATSYSSDSDGSSVARGKSKKDCWNRCDYPSECRWGRQFGVHTPVVETPVVPPSVQSSPKAVQAALQQPTNTTFEGILKMENVSPATHVKTGGKDNKGTSKSSDKAEKSEKGDFWGALLASATRRKSTPPSSPLATVSEEAEPEYLPSYTTATSTSSSTPASYTRTHTHRKDQDGDILMTSSADVQPKACTPLIPTPALTLTTPSSSKTPTTTTPLSLKNILTGSSSHNSKQTRRSKSASPTRSFARSSNSPSRTQQLQRPTIPKRSSSLTPILRTVDVTLPKPVIQHSPTTFSDFDFGVRNASSVEEFAPLERVRSRDSGYASPTGVEDGML